MTARNIGVVFGREYTASQSRSLVAHACITATLMRSRDPASEFSDMAGKAITVEWLVDHAPAIFAPPPPH